MKNGGKSALTLIPSENVTSSAVRSLLSSEFGHRHPSRDRFYMGTIFLEEIRQKGEEMAKRVSNFKTTELRPPQGMMLT